MQDFPAPFLFTVLFRDLLRIRLFLLLSSHFLCKYSSAFSEFFMRPDC